MRGKKMMLLLLCLFYFMTSLQGQVIEKCKEDEYPPKKNEFITTKIVNLDVDPHERWKHIVKPKKKEIVDFINFARSLLPSPILAVVEKLLDSGLDKLPSPYKEEIVGIADTLGISKAEIFAANVFYELEKLCTSIVTRDDHGSIYHARNMDLGALLGWDKKGESWKIAELLRPLSVNIDFQRNGTTVYKSVQFAGSVGVFTGVVPKRFSLSLNSRSADHLFEGPFSLIKWLYFSDEELHFASFFARTALEKSRNFSDAVNMLSTGPLLVSVYYIVAGVKPEQATVISRTTTGSVNPLKFSSPKNWYLLQTNYDHWKDPPFYDDRRTPARICLNRARNSATRDYDQYTLLYNVLSTIPVLNKATIYTALMSAKDGKLESYRRNCEGLCYPW